MTIEDFDISGVLGQGSYGKVYSAIDKLTKKKFAIKVMDKYHIVKNKKIDNAFRERDLLMHLSHPNIIK